MKVDTEKFKRCCLELENLGLSSKQINDSMEEIELVFIGEDDFCSSLEFFLNFRIGKIKP
ncbi:hypothetical protein JCM16418A_29400 [Paenibacillus pini]